MNVRFTRVYEKTTHFENEFIKAGFEEITIDYESYFKGFLAMNHCSQWWNYSSNHGTIYPRFEL